MNDLETWKTWLPVIKDIVLILTPIITIILAIRSVNKWKGEFKGKANFEASYKLLKAVYSLRDNLSSSRSALIMANEALPREPKIDNYEAENIYHVLKNRLVPLSEAYRNFNSILPEVEALFGKKIYKICLEINGVMFSYKMVVNEYIQLYGKTNNNEHLKNLSNMVFSRPDNDEIKKELDSIIEKIEKEITKHIKMN